jgi:hypothetical protein
MVSHVRQLIDLVRERARARPGGAQCRLLSKGEACACDLCMADRAEKELREWAAQRADFVDRLKAAQWPP